MDAVPAHAGVALQAAISNVEGLAPCRFFTNW
jgi:hypothetical protein